jgi:iron(III) transport system permease protein
MGRAWVWGGACAIFVIVCVLPTAAMLAGSFTGEAGRGTLDAYRGVLSDARQWQLLTTSMSLGVGAALVAGALGMPVGLALARGVTVPGPWRVVTIAPLLIPPYVMAVAWTLTIGPSGPLASVLSARRLNDWAYSAWAAPLVLGISLYPLVALAVDAALARVDVHAEDAARLVAPPMRVFSHITLPLMAPTVSVVLLLVFALAITEFGVPGLLRVRVYTTEVFTAFSAFYDAARATALAAPLLGAVLAIVVVGSRAADALMMSSRRSTIAPRSPTALARLAAHATLVGAAIVALVLPLTILARDAAMGTRSSVDGSGAAALASLLLASASAVLVTALSAILGHARGSVRRGGWWLDAACAWLFAVPGTVVGVGLILVWNRPGLDSIYGTPAILIVANLARFLPLGILIVAAAARQISPSLEEAAALAGASWFRRWRRIWLPQMRNALMAVAGLTFVFAFGELGTAVLVTPPGLMTLPVHVYTVVANAPPGELARLALVQAAAGLAGVVLLARVSLGRPA